MAKWLQRLIVATTLVSLSWAFMSPDNDPIVLQRGRILQRFAASHNFRDEVGPSTILSHQPLVPITSSSLDVLPVLCFVGKVHIATSSPESAIGLDVRPGRAPPTHLSA